VWRSCDHEERHDGGLREKGASKVDFGVGGEAGRWCEEDLDDAQGVATTLTP